MERWHTLSGRWKGFISFKYYQKFELFFTQYPSPRPRDASTLRRSQENHFQSPQSSQSFEENFETSVAF